jgi:hypothetical protein
LRPHDASQPIGSDETIATNHFTAFEAGCDTVAVLFEFDALPAKVKAARINTLRKQSHQFRPMHNGNAGEAFARHIGGDQHQHIAIRAPQSALRAGDTLSSNRIPESQHIERDQRIRHETDAGSDLAQSRSLLEYLYVDPESG